MVQPYNYSINVPQTNIAPYMASIGQTLAGQLERYQEAQAQQRQAQLLSEQQRQLQMQFASDMQIYKNDPSATNFTTLVTRYPQLKDQLTKAHEAMSEEQRQAQLSVLQPAYAAFSSGDISSASQVLAERRTALENAGKTAQARNVDNLIKAIDENPASARMQFHMILSGLLGPDKAVESFKMFETMPAEKRTAEAKAGQEEAEAIRKQAEARVASEKLALSMALDKATKAKLEADMKNDSRRLDIEEAKLMLQADKEFNGSGVADLYVELTGPLKESIKKDYVDAGVKRQSAFKMQNLADQIQKRGGAGWKGVAGYIAEYFKEALGEEDIDTYLKKQYSFGRSSAAMATLRGTGSVSNFELDTVLTGWPGINANNELKIAWLRGTAKMAQMDADIDAARGKWASMNRGVLGPSASGKPMVISGIVVPPSVDFDEFADQYLYPSLQAKYFPDQEAQRDLEDGFIEESPSAVEEGMSMMPGGQ